MFEKKGYFKILNILKEFEKKIGEHVVKFSILLNRALTAAHLNSWRSGTVSK